MQRAIQYVFFFTRQQEVLFNDGSFFYLVLVHEVFELLFGKRIQQFAECEVDVKVLIKIKSAVVVNDVGLRCAIDHTEPAMAEYCIKVFAGTACEKTDL